MTKSTPNGLKKTNPSTQTQMSDKTRRHTPDERVSPIESNLLEPHPFCAQGQAPNLAHKLANVTTYLETPLTNPPPTSPDNLPNPQTLLNQLLNALTSPDENLHTLIHQLPNTWQATNNKGTPLNKTMLQRCTWGELREADALQSLQHAILTAHPPPNHTVTQYTTYITTSMSMGSSIWRQAIRNACNDDHLPHPLHNDTTIFNIHHNNHYTTLIATNNTYYYYDPLNYPTPPPVTMIHHTLKEWYKDLPTPPLLTTQHPTVVQKSTPRQTDGWSCGLHMLLINLATIYQGGPPTLRHTQRHAEHLSRIQLRYTLTGDLDPTITQVLTLLKRRNTAHPDETHSIPSYPSNTPPPPSSHSQH